MQPSAVLDDDRLHGLEPAGSTDSVRDDAVSFSCAGVASILLCCVG